MKLSDLDRVNSIMAERRAREADLHRAQEGQIAVLLGPVPHKLERVSGPQGSVSRQRSIEDMCASAEATRGEGKIVHYDDEQMQASIRSSVEADLAARIAALDAELLGLGVDIAA